MYSKAWVIPWKQGTIGIAYEREDGMQGFIPIDRAGHPELPALMEKLSDADLHTLEQRLQNVIPFNRTRH